MVLTPAAHPTAAVNPPGYSYYITATGLPTAAPCGPNTYSLGYNRNRACNPCPSGTVTEPAQVQGTQTSSSVCSESPGLSAAAAAASH